jgi:hypothetical protein
MGSVTDCGRIAFGYVISGACQRRVVSYIGEFQVQGRRKLLFLDFDYEVWKSSLR